MDDVQREAMEFDVLIVGAGPAGLAAAIRLKQINPDTNVCVVEKGGEVGAHILSGAVLEPRALDELLPDWREDPPALMTPATEDRFMLLTAKRAIRLPTPAAMHNEGNYIVSLGNVVRWLGQKADALGVEIYPGFAASETIIEDGVVKGVVAGVMGIAKDGSQGPDFQPGMELRATYTLFAEGCRGSLTKQLMAHYDLRAECAPQTYALGIKELWEIPKENHKPGLVWHSTGWPLPSDTYGGSWLYMLGDNLVSSASWSGWTIPTRGCRPSTSSSASSTIRRWRPCWRRQAHLLRGAGAERGRLPGDPQAGLPGGALIGDTRASSTCPRSRARTRR
jgi:electron-transferring-flavoprotein dehydrogenase